MAEINDLDVTDASNTGRFPENQAPSSVNDGARALEGILARGFKDTMDGYIVTGGTSTAYTVAANRTISAYYDGLIQMVEWNAASGAAPTINIDAVAAKALVRPDQTAIGINELVAGGRSLIQYDSGNDNFMVLTGISDIALSTEQAATSGVTIPFTGVPAWAKEVKVKFVIVSTSGASPPIIQIGPAGGIEATGYTGTSSAIATTVNTSSYTTGFGIQSANAANILNGTITLTLEDASDNTWSAAGVLAASNVPATITTAGVKALAGALALVTITTLNGTDTFDGGAINISWA